MMEEVNLILKSELFEAIMKEKWRSNLLIKQIIAEIPDFLFEVYNNQKTSNFLYNVGIYHTNSAFLYELSSLSLNQFNHVLYCERHDRAADCMLERMMAITMTAILEMAIVRTNKTIFLKVLKVFPLKSIVFLKRKKKFGNYVCMAFGSSSNKMYQDQELSFEYFLVPNVEELIEKFLTAASFNGAIVSNNTVLKEGEIAAQEYKSEQEVETNPKNSQMAPPLKSHYTKSYENDLLKRIAELESIIEETLDHDAIQELVSLYAKATEMYSSNPESEYMLFTVKTQSLLAREDIQAVLESTRNVNLLQMELSDTSQPPQTPEDPANKALLDLELDTPAPPEESNKEPIIKAQEGFLFTEEDEEKKSDCYEESLSPSLNFPPKEPIQSSADSKKEFNLLDMEPEQPPKTEETSSEESPEETETGEPPIEPEITPKKDKPLESTDLLDLNPSNYQSTAEKLKRRVRNKENGEESSSLSPSKNTEGVTPNKPSLPSSLKTTPFKEDQQKDESKPFSSTKKQSTPLIVRKDSLSDEENKFVIG